MIKNISFKVDEKFHTDIKVHATKKGKAIKDYIIELIKKDLESKEQKK